MSQQLAALFRDALSVLEETGNAESLASLYSDGAEVGNVLHPAKFHGPEGAHHFWREYRASFGAVRSTFRSVIVDETQAALEWETDGESLQGQRFRYSGVTILESDGGKITRSCAYFDPSALGEQISGSS